MKVAMMGVGKLGAPCADEMFKAGHDVVGYDINPQEPTLFPMVDSIKEAVTGRDLIFIAVPTPHDPEYGGETPSAFLHPKDFDYTIVEDILVKLNDYCTKDQLVVLISTVLPGTTRDRFAPLVKNYRFIYNPYLIAMGSTAWDMINPEMVIIGTEDGSVTGDAKTLIDFYQTMMVNNPRYEVGTWDEAECIKIFYNTFISTKIGLVNMIQDVAEKSGNINVDVVTNALAKSDMRITGPAYMRAGMGDSGACHPRDNIALRWLSMKLDLGYDIFGTIMKAREVQAKNVAEKLVRLAVKHSMPIYIHGKAYKPGVEYTNGSYSLLIGYWVEKISRGVIVPQYIDPLTGGGMKNQTSVKGVILMAHHSPTTYSYCKTIGEKEQRFYCEIEPGSIIVDIWRYLTPDDVPGCTLIHYGNTRKSK